MLWQQGHSVNALRYGLVSLSKRPFLRNVAAVAGGTAAAQGITMAFAPFITRLYGPEAFGVQGAFLSLVSIVTPLSALAYPIAIVLPKSETDAVALKRLSMLVALGIAIALLLALVLLFDPLTGLLRDDSVTPFLWLLPIVVVLAAWLQVTRQWLIRNESFKILARIAVLQALLVNSARVGLGLLSATAAMLVAVTTAGLGFHALMQWWGARDGPVAAPTLGELQHQAARYKDFPLFRAPEMILNAISEGLPVLVFAAAFSPAEAGYYALARSVLYLPLNLIGQSVADVFYPRLNAHALANRPMLPALIKAWGVLAAIGLPLFAIIAATSPHLFSIVFGDEWAPAGLYSALLCVWLFFMFVNRPCISATSVLSMQKIFLMQGVLTLALRAASLWVGVHVLESDIWAVALFSLSSAATALLLVVLVALRAKRVRYGMAERASR